MVVHSDGSGLHTIAPTLNAITGPLSWSPNGQWIAAAHRGIAGIAQYLYLVDSNAGTAVRLPYAFQWTIPDWR